MSRRALGRLVAASLEGAWRADPPRPTLEHDERARVAPLLLRTGAGGLGWWRLRGTDAANGAAAAELKDAFRIQTLEARLHEEQLAASVAVLEEAGVPVVMSKGWSVATRYPAAGLRPYGDYDLHVPPDRTEEAARALESSGTATLVDLHPAVPRLPAAWDDLRGRSRPGGLEGTALRVLGDADHLTLLCTHLLEHGAWRPLWLCDVALLAEDAGADLDWGAALGAHPLAEHVRACVLLAHRLLGARLDATPWTPADADALPGWLVGATLAAWGAGGHYSLTTRLALTRARPRAFLEALAARWPNPIEATIRAGAPLDDGPRLPWQLRDVARRLLKGAPDSAPVVARRIMGRR